MHDTTAAIISDQRIKASTKKDTEVEGVSKQHIT
jgi:hypothetical protein